MKERDSQASRAVAAKGGSLCGSPSRGRPVSRLVSARPSPSEGRRRMWVPPGRAAATEQSGGPAWYRTAARARWPGFLDPGSHGESGCRDGALHSHAAGYPLSTQAERAFPGGQPTFLSSHCWEPGSESPVSPQEAKDGAGQVPGRWVRRSEGNPSGEEEPAPGEAAGAASREHVSRRGVGGGWAAANKPKGEKENK